MFVSLLHSYTEALVSSVMMFKGGGLLELIKSCGASVNCSALIKRENGEMIFPYMWGCSKKAAICKPGGEPSLDIESVSTMILDFPVSRTTKNNICCLSHLAHGN